MDFKVLEGPLAIVFKVKDPKLGCVLKVGWELPPGAVWEEFAKWFEETKFEVEIESPKNTVRLPAWAHRAQGTFSGGDVLTVALGPKHEPEEFPLDSWVRFYPLS